MLQLDCVIVEPEITATASVIWLHGLGANGHDFEPIVPELELPKSLPVRFVFPHAESIPVTVNGGVVMPAWYDIISLDLDRKFNEPQLLNAAEAVIALINREIEKGIDSTRIIVAGFSQGGAVAYQAALSFAKPLAGLMTLSTYFATDASINCHSANSNIPISVYHGASDPVVPEILGQNAITVLTEKGYQPEYKTYLMQHEVCTPQIKDISLWLQKCLN